jgi:hypothetical protein
MQVTKWSGKPITRPGWYSGIPIERYHSPGMCDGPAVSSSNLRTLWSKSEAHMYAEWCEAPNYQPREATRAMILGAAAHHLFLGEDGFNMKFIAQPENYRDSKTAELKKWNGNANVCKDWIADAEDAGRVIVKPDEFKAIKGMAASLTSQPLVQDGLLSGLVECSGFVKDKATGLWLKVRPDVIPISGPDFVDLKTTADVTSHALQYTMRSFGYHQQGALIWEVCEALGLPFASFNLMFVETSAPFCARRVELTDKDLEDGRRINRVALKRIAKAMTLKHWPGPGEHDGHALPFSHDERARTEARLKIEEAA